MLQILRCTKHCRAFAPCLKPLILALSVCVFSQNVLAGARRPFLTSSTIKYTIFSTQLQLMVACRDVPFACVRNPPAACMKGWIYLSNQPQLYRLFHINVASDFHIPEAPPAEAGATAEVAV